jgi:hypothetical protein
MMMRIRMTLAMSVIGMAIMAMILGMTHHTYHSHVHVQAYTVISSAATSTSNVSSKRTKWTSKRSTCNPQTLQLSLSSATPSASKTTKTTNKSDDNNVSSLSEQEQAFYQRGRMAKLMVETERLKWEEGQGYFVEMMGLPRLGATYPKRKFLLGAKKGTSTANRISCLSCYTSSTASSTQLYGKLTDDDDDDGNGFGKNIIEEEEQSNADRMDLGGFTNYLLP